MKSQPKKTTTVYVAMSGGVDSSVAVALLKKHGFKVVGVFMKMWNPEGNDQFQTSNFESNSNSRIQNSAQDLCIWKQEREDAIRVASVLDVPLLTWDFSREYGKKVAKYMVDAYRKGITPNPDVMCNKEIKFGLFLKKALKEGADYIATGHYARLKRNDQFRISNSKSIPNSRIQNSDIYSKFKTQNSKFCLLQAKDRNKDQSYFLWTLTQKQLGHCLFPIGDYTKPQVRALAKKFKLPVAEKKDSQGICFVGELDMHDFLTRYIKHKPGKIILSSRSDLSSPQGRTLRGCIIGEHDGVYYYTIGQRHGLDIKDGGGPYFVTGKDLKKNIIYVGSEKDLLSKKAVVKDINWIGGKPKSPARLDVKIRYRSESVTARLVFLDSLFVLNFSCPVRAITPGQSVVFYKGEEMLGGGIITK